MTAKQSHRHPGLSPNGTTAGEASPRRDIGPYHATRPRAPHGRVGRDVPGAPRPRGRPRGCQRGCGPQGTSAPTTPHARAHPMVGRDVPGAPRQRGRPRGRQRERGPPRTSAPTRWRQCSKHRILYHRPCLGREQRAVGDEPQKYMLIEHQFHQRSPP